uniref:Chitin-binding type-1 domain-containing protein n=1 Tax=Branchiostoma floridae TaxID=7739 RepID=C3XQ56_BRAFL|eukprot:XP_002614068.1 hypothetical protein BRAFLDRAFT_67346 [Branchiostoma floridae]
MRDGLRRNPMYVPNVPQQARSQCNYSRTGVAVIVTALLVASSAFGTWISFDNNVQKTGEAVYNTSVPGQPAVDSTYTNAQPAVDTSYSNGQPAVDTTYTNGQPTVDTTYTNGQPAVDTTYTNAQPAVDTTYTNAQPAVDSTYTNGQPAVDTTYTNGQPAVDSTYTHGQPAVDTTYTNGQPAVDTTYIHAHPTVDTTNTDAPKKKWRDDLRCGQGYPADDGNPAECDPDGKYPCCSDGHWCGNSPDHCRRRRLCRLQKEKGHREKRRQGKTFRTSQRESQSILTCTYN